MLLQSIAEHTDTKSREIAAEHLQIEWRNNGNLSEFSVILARMLQCMQIYSVHLVYSVYAKYSVQID